MRRRRRKRAEHGSDGQSGSRRCTTRIWMRGWTPTRLPTKCASQRATNLTSRTRPRDARRRNRRRCPTTNTTRSDRAGSSQRLLRIPEREAPVAVGLEHGRFGVAAQSLERAERVQRLARGAVDEMKIIVLRRGKSQRCRWRSKISTNVCHGRRTRRTRTPTAAR